MTDRDTGPPPPPPPLAAAAADDDDDDDTESEGQGEWRSDGGDGGNGGGRKKIITEIGRLRRQWLVEKVLEETMLLSSEIGRSLQTAERAAGNSDAILPDKKVYQRVIAAAVEAGEVCVLHIAVPGVHGSLQQRSIMVLAPPGASAEDPGFVNAVFERHRALQKRVRVATHFRQRVRDAESGGKDIPTVAVQTLVPAVDVLSASALKEKRFKMLLANGYVSARMLRCRALHDAVWRFISSRRGPPTELDPGLLKAAATGKAFLVGRSPVSMHSINGGKSESNGGVVKGKLVDVGAFSATPDQCALVFTADELWRELSVGTFLTCLGSRAEAVDEGARRLQRDTGRKLGTYDF